MSNPEKILEDAIMQVMRRTCGQRECPRLKMCHVSPHSCLHAKTAIANRALATYRANTSAPRSVSGGSPT
jgi:hypothetical protein